jgi:hypothetical protein
VHKPHLASGYIQKVSFKAATDDEGSPDWLMCYEPGQKSRTEFKAFNDKRSHNNDALIAETAPEPETSEESVQDDSRDLVLYFHRRFHQDETVTATPKDLDFAGELIAKYGMEKARFVIEYSQEAAAATKYSPGMLVGIRKYVDTAIKTFETREKRRQQQESQEREAKLQDRYQHYRNTKIQEIESTLSAHELEDLKAAIRERLLAKNSNPTGINLGIQIELNSELADRANVPPFVEWRKQYE